MAAYNILGFQCSSWYSKLAIQRKLAWNQMSMRLDIASNTNCFKTLLERIVKGAGEPAITLLARDCRGEGSKYFASLCSVEKSLWIEGEKNLLLWLVTQKPFTCKWKKGDAGMAKRFSNYMLGRALYPAHWWCLAEWTWLVTVVIKYNSCIFMVKLRNYFFRKQNSTQASTWNIVYLHENH